MSEEEDDRKFKEILDENAESLSKIRALAEGLETVVEHELRIIDVPSLPSEKDSKGPSVDPTG